jgi:hypothetical protein
MEVCFALSSDIRQHDDFVRPGPQLEILCICLLIFRVYDHGGFACLWCAFEPSNEVPHVPDWLFVYTNDNFQGSRWSLVAVEARYVTTILESGVVHDRGQDAEEQHHNNMENCTRADWQTYRLSL